MEEFKGKEKGKEWKDSSLPDWYRTYDQWIMENELQVNSSGRPYRFFNGTVGRFGGCRLGRAVRPCHPSSWDGD